jgi:hypothetical protein
VSRRCGTFRGLGNGGPMRGLAVAATPPKHRHTVPSNRADVSIIPGAGLVELFQDADGVLSLVVVVNVRRRVPPVWLKRGWVVVEAFEDEVAPAVKLTITPEGARVAREAALLMSLEGAGG